MASNAGKGSKRRPGIIPPTAWERIFNPEMCQVCGDAKWKCGCAPSDGAHGQDDGGDKERES